MLSLISRDSLCLKGVLGVLLRCILQIFTACYLGSESDVLPRVKQWSCANLALFSSVINQFFVCFSFCSQWEE